MSHIRCGNCRLLTFPGRNMRDLTPPCPTGSDRKSTFMQWVWRKLTKELRFCDSATIKVNRRVSGISFDAIGSSPSFKFPWQYPKELDPTVPVQSGEFVFISAQNPLVTTGLHDVQSNVLVKATEGIWQALQFVPAQISQSGTTAYNVPHALAEVATAGSPLRGDADDGTLFWLPWGSSAVGSACYQLSVVSEALNYLNCTYVAPGNPLNGVSVKVAKPPELQGFIASTTDSQGTPQNILPPYAGADLIFAEAPLGGTGVAGVILQDLNVAARALATQLNTCENIAGVPTLKSRYFVCSIYS